MTDVQTGPDEILIDGERWIRGTRHDARCAELLAANNVEVERRRAAESKLIGDDDAVRKPTFVTVPAEPTGEWVRTIRATHGIGFHAAAELINKVLASAPRVKGGAS